MRSVYLRCSLHSAQEEGHKPSQAVLIHGVNASQVSNAEEEQAASDSHGAVLLPGRINLLLCAFSFFYLAGNVIAGGLHRLNRTCSKGCSCRLLGESTAGSFEHFDCPVLIHVPMPEMLLCPKAASMF